MAKGNHNFLWGAILAAGSLSIVSQVFQMPKPLKALLIRLEPQKHLQMPPQDGAPNQLTRNDVEDACGLSHKDTTLGPRSAYLSQALLRTDLSNCESTPAIRAFFAGNGNLHDLVKARNLADRTVGVTDPKAFDRADRLIPGNTTPHSGATDCDPRTHIFPPGTTFDDCSKSMPFESQPNGGDGSVKLPRAKPSAGVQQPQ